VLLSLSLVPLQVFQVLLSFWAFPKPISWKHVVGFLFVLLSLWWLQVRERIRNSAVAAAERECMHP
jgi:hypothetical protein